MILIQITSLFWAYALSEKVASLRCFEVLEPSPLRSLPPMLIFFLVATRHSTLFNPESWSTSICLYVQKYNTLCVVWKKQSSASRCGWRKVFGSCTRKQLSEPMDCPNSYNCARVSQRKMLCANELQPSAHFNLLRPSLPLLSIISFSVSYFASMFWFSFSDVLFLYQGITVQCNFCVYVNPLTHKSCLYSGFKTKSRSKFFIIFWFVFHLDIFDRP